MSIFNTALTGLKAYQTDIAVVGNNIANANTTGFKASRAEFANLLVQTLQGATMPSGRLGGSDPLQMGTGVTVSSVLSIHEQGALQPTGRPSDLAIEGNGFFVLSDGVGTSFTRVGTFKTDANGKLVDSATGLKVQGLQGDISISLGSSLTPAAATSAVTLTGNLDAGATSGTIVDTAFFVIDSLGAKDQVDIRFTKAASGNSWNYAVSGQPASGGGFTVPIGSGGTITFASGGSISSIVPPLSGLSFDPGNGAAPVVFSILASGSVTQFSAPSNVAMSSQNGLPPGNLVSFNVARNGTVTGISSNGTRQTIDTLKLASFANPAGLLRLSDNRFAESPNSGGAVFGTAGTGDRGSIAGGNLEQSNVDLAAEFVNLIIAQRGYEANARVLTVADQVQQATVNLVR